MAVVSQFHLDNFIFTTRCLDKRSNRALIFLTTGWMYAYTALLYPRLMRYYIPVLNVRGPKGGTSHAKRTER